MYYLVTCFPVTLWGLCARQTIPLSVLARNPNKGLKLEVSRVTGSGRGEVGAREERGQLTKEPRDGRRQRTAEETSWREIAVQGKDGQQKEAFKDDLTFLVAIVEVLRKIHAHDSLQNARKPAQNRHKTPFLALGADPSPYCLFVLPSTLLVAFLLWL